MTSLEKQDLLWQSTLDFTWENLPSYSDAKTWGNRWKAVKALFTLDESFATESDFMPEGRVKLIHAFGSVAKVEFLPIYSDENKYTGLFKGAHGLMRISLAGDPGEDNFTPGLALKLFINLEVLVKK